MHDPKSLKSKGRHYALFTMPSRKELEKTAKSLMCRLFSMDESDSQSSGSEDESLDNVEDFQKKLLMKVTKAEDQKVPKDTKDQFNSLSKEFSLYIESKSRTPNLELLYRALLNIPPTSVTCERLFSKSGFLVSNRRSSLEDRTIDDLCFLQWWFTKRD